MECLFCRIAAGAAPADVVLEDDDFLAFLDHRPLFPGHCLLIPKKHYETLEHFPAAQSGLLANTQLLCRAVEDALGADGAFVAINHRVSQSVPHLHVHIVPRRKKDGLRGFFWPRAKYKTAEEAERIRSAIAQSASRLKESRF